MSQDAKQLDWSQMPDTGLQSQRQSVYKSIADNQFGTPNMSVGQALLPTLASVNGTPGAD